MCVSSRQFAKNKGRQVGNADLFRKRISWIAIVISHSQNAGLRSANRSLRGLIHLLSASSGSISTIHTISRHGCIRKVLTGGDMMSCP
jgi:hypothetical protein